MGPENLLISKIDRERAQSHELPPIIRQAHEKAVAEVLHNPACAIQERDFIGVYDEKSIEADLREADRLQHGVFKDSTEGEKGARVYAETLEGLIIAHGKKSKWLGDAETLKTARFDDYKNGVDMLAEWVTREGMKFLGLAVDVTFGTTGIRSKLTGIKEEINGKEFGRVRYFKDTHGNFKGTRYNVPRALLGVSKELVAELSGLWLNDEHALETHSVQTLFLEELHIQLTAMRAYAEKRGKHDIVASYDQALAVIRPLLAEKKKFTDPALRRDPVAALIFIETQKLFS